MYRINFLFVQIKRLLYKAGGKILWFCLVISVLTTAFLTGYITAYEPDCKREHMEIVDRKHDWVPTEEFARGIAGASIGLGDKWETQDNVFYTVECIYNEERYEWIVVFTPIEDENTGRKRIVGIRRDIGLITIYQ